jgi:hypothetical protein
MLTPNQAPWAGGIAVTGPQALLRVRASEERSVEDVESQDATPRAHTSVSTNRATAKP